MASAAPGMAPSGVAVNEHVSVDSHGPRPPERKRTGHSVLEEGSIPEHGRTYHSYKEGSYLLPNDGEEQDRLDLQHETINALLDGRLSWVPLRSPKHVLDIATGTGIWAIQFARRNPDSIVVGTDLSLIQPSNVVPNVEFIKEDADEIEWTLPYKFDLIHLRMTYTCFSNFPQILINIYKNLKPGGWVEFQDLTPEASSQDGSSRGTALELYGASIIKGLGRMGRDATRIRYLNDMLQSLGFEDIKSISRPCPMGSWPSEPKWKYVGHCMDRNINRGLGASVKLLTAAGLTVAEATELGVGVQKELKYGLVHSYLPFFVVYAKKPETGYWA